MIDWLTDPFALHFQQRALLGGAFVAITLSMIGTWVVIRGMSFLGDALVHGIIPGIAAAILLDFNVLLGAVVSAFIMVAGIELVRRQTAFSEDTSIGLLFVGMLGLGVIMISRTSGYTGSITQILFGNVLGVSNSDVLGSAATALIVIIASVFLYRPFLVMAFSEKKARLLGLQPKLAHLVVLSLITLSIIGSFQTVGTILSLGFIVGPPATATLLVRRVPMIMATAALIGVISVFIGLVVSFHADTSGSATMAVVPIVMFFIVLTVRSIMDRRQHIP